MEPCKHLGLKKPLLENTSCEVRASVGTMPCLVCDERHGGFPVIKRGLLICYECVAQGALEIIFNLFCTYKAKHKRVKTCLGKIAWDLYRDEVRTRAANIKVIRHRKKNIYGF